MAPEDIIRAWKDRRFRNRLNEEQKTALPENPAGFIELSEIELHSASGASLTASPLICTTGGGCSNSCTEAYPCNRPTTEGGSLSCSGCVSGVGITCAGTGTTCPGLG